MNEITLNNTENNTIYTRIPKVLAKSNENELKDGKPGENMIENIDINKAQQIPTRATAQHTDQNITPVNGVDISINADFKLLVDKAILSQPQDTDKVNTAKKLLDSGLLESDLYYQQTAENILKLGI